MYNLPVEIYSGILQYLENDLWKFPQLAKKYNEIFILYKDSISTTIIHRYLQFNDPKYKIDYTTYKIIMKEYFWIITCPMADNNCALSKAWLHKHNNISALLDNLIDEYTIDTPVNLIYIFDDFINSGKTKSNMRDIFNLTYLRHHTNNLIIVSD